MYNNMDSAESNSSQFVILFVLIRILFVSIRIL